VAENDPDYDEIPTGCDRYHHGECRDERHLASQTTSGQLQQQRRLLHKITTLNVNATITIISNYIIVRPLQSQRAPPKDQRTE